MVVIRWGSRGRLFKQNFILFYFCSHFMLEARETLKWCSKMPHKEKEKNYEPIPIKACLDFIFSSVLVQKKSAGHRTFLDSKIVLVCLKPTYRGLLHVWCFSSEQARTDPGCFSISGKSKIIPVCWHSCASAAWRQQLLTQHFCLSISN